MHKVHVGKCIVIEVEKKKGYRIGANRSLSDQIALLNETSQRQLCFERVRRLKKAVQRLSPKSTVVNEEIRTLAGIAQQLSRLSP